MRMKELSERSGVPVASIKFYLREGLLPAGRATSSTQACYDDTHVERLRLVRVLREVGNLPIARIGAVIAAIEDETLPLHDLLATAHHGLGPPPPAEPPDEAHRRARAEVLEHLRAKGWCIDDAAPSLDVLAGALSAIRLLWFDCGPDLFDDYAAVAMELARGELDSLDPGAGRSAIVRDVMIGTVIFEQALVSLRRLAEEHHSHRRFGPRDNGRSGA